MHCESKAHPLQHITLCFQGCRAAVPCYQSINIAGMKRLSVSSIGLHDHSLLSLIGVASQETLWRACTWWVAVRSSCSTVCPSVVAPCLMPGNRKLPGLMACAREVEATSGPSAVRGQEAFSPSTPSKSMVCTLRKLPIQTIHTVQIMYVIDRREVLVWEASERHVFRGGGAPHPAHAGGRHQAVWRLLNIKGGLVAPSELACWHQAVWRLLTIKGGLVASAAVCRASAPSKAAWETAYWCS